MKSVGEVMAIGRTFQESLQKALRGLETGLTGLDEIEIDGLGRGDDKNAIRAALGTPTPDRLLQVAQAMRLGWSNDEIFNSCKIDPWFLAEMRGIVEMEAKVRQTRPAAERVRHAHAEGDGLFRRAARGAFADPRGRGDGKAPRARRPSGVQAHRHLRGRIRLAHRLYVFDL